MSSMLPATFRRFTIDEYHSLIRQGFLTEEENVELLEGYLIVKKSKNPPHEGTIQLLTKALLKHLPSGWELRIQSAITLSASEPEPDLVIARGNERSYLTRHPGPSDVGLVIEVADSSLASDRADKGRIYARDGIGCYWIVNLQDRQIEVYTAPSGPTTNHTYANRQDYLAGQQIPVVLEGKTITSCLVDDLLP